MMQRRHLAPRAACHAKMQSLQETHVIFNDGGKGHQLAGRCLKTLGLLHLTDSLFQQLGAGEPNELTAHTI